MPSYLIWKELKSNYFQRILFRKRVPDLRDSFSIYFKFMKYRKLLLEELAAVKDEFVKFLALNSIVADEWEKLKSENSPKVEELMELFSDLFWDKSLSNIKCVEFRSPEQLMVFHFGENQAEMLELRVPVDAGVDLSNPEHLRNLAEGKVKFESAGPEMYTAVKSDLKDRNKELFELIEKGARPCPESFYYGLKAMAVS